MIKFISPILAWTILFAYLALLPKPASSDERFQNKMEKMPSPQVRLLDDFKFYTGPGPYSVYTAPFNKGELVNGKDFTEAINVHPDIFPLSTTMTWNWPTTPCRGICGFLQIAFGDYNGTVPKDPIVPKRVVDIKNLVLQHELEFSGTRNGYDVIYDLFLTSQPHGGVNQVFEIEIFLHSPSYSKKFVHSATQIGTFSASGKVWTVAITSDTVPDILFMPTDQSDLLAGSIDLKAFLKYLMEKSLITGNEYYNGHALGVEPRHGRGFLTAKKMQVDFD